MKPVSKGDTARSSQQLGAIKNIRPTANAACGTASIGPRARTMRPHMGKAKLRDSNQAHRPKASAVDTRPVHKLMRHAGQSRGAVVTSVHAAKCQALAIQAHRMAAKGSNTKLAKATFATSLTDRAAGVVWLQAFRFRLRSGAATLSQSGRPNCRGARVSRVQSAPPGLKLQQRQRARHRRPAFCWAPIRWGRPTR